MTKIYCITAMLIGSLTLTSCAPTVGGNNDESRREYIVSMDNNQGSISIDMTAAKEEDVMSTSDRQTGATLSPETRIAASMPTGGSTSSIAGEGAEVLLKDISSMAQQISRRIEQAQEAAAAAAVEETTTTTTTTTNPTSGEITQEMIDAAPYQKYYDHTTTASSDGGKSLVLCPGDDRKDLDCNVGDVHIPFHGYDTGRVAYWNMKEEPIGDIVCTDDEGKIFKYKAVEKIDRASCDSADKDI